MRLYKTGIYIFILIILIALVVIAVSPSSIITNYDSTGLSGTLLMKVQKLNGATWTDKQVIYNQAQTIAGASTLNLDSLWSAAGAYNTTNDAGHFRVYASLLNSSGQPIQTTLGKLEATYEFDVLGPDVIPPYVAFISPINTTYTTTSIIVQITNNSDAKNIWWYNGTRNLTYSGIVTLTLSNGSYSFIAYANDSAGNLNSSKVTFAIKTASFASELIAYYKLDGNANDETGNNNGVITGADCSAAGKIGQACKFTGGATYISIPDSSNLNVGSNFSIALWINISQMSGSSDYFYFFQRGSSSSSRLFMSLGPGSRITLGVADLYWGSTKANFQTGTWYHIVYTHQGNSDTEKIYIDGTLDKSQGGRTKDAYNNGSLTLGRQTPGTDTSYSYKGLLDEVRIYNKVLSDAEINDLYNLNLSADTTPPTFTNLANQILTLGQSLSYDINADDASGVSCFKVNDTINFQINCAGLLINKTALGLGIRYLNISVNDTLNNINSGIIFVNVSSIACVQNLQNTTKTNWVNLTCVSNQRNQSRSWIQYDSNNCGYMNTTFYEYQLVGPVWQNTTWSNWVNVSCISNQMNQSRNLTQYDSYGCGINTTFFQYQLSGTCGCIQNLQNTTWSNWADIENCRIDDNKQQSQNKTQYDANNCGYINQTFFNYQNISCNYCSYNIQNTTWSNWQNISCLSDNTMNQSRSNTEYDANYNTCYAVTHLPSDLWNSGNNITNFDYRHTQYCQFDTTPPYFNPVPSNQAITYGNNFAYSTHADDNIVVSSYKVNDTRFGINQFGYITSGILSAAIYWINESVNDTSGNQNSAVFSLTVNKASSQTSLTFDKNSPQNYGTAITPSCSLLLGQGNTILKVNNQIINSGQAIILSAGYHIFNCSYAGNQNYTSSSQQVTYQINQALGQVSLLLNNSAGNIKFVLGGLINASAKSSSQLIQLLRNSIDVTSENNIYVSLPIGYYNYTAIALENQNYSQATITRFLNITDYTCGNNVKEGNEVCDGSDLDDLSCNGFFVVGYRDNDPAKGQFIVALSSQEQIALAEANIREENNLHPSGRLVMGDGNFNYNPLTGDKWSWHTKPAETFFVEQSIELCDGSPFDVESNVDGWVNNIKYFCPWLGRAKYKEFSGGSLSCLQDCSGFITSLCTETDTIYPVFSNYQDNNGTIINLGTALFNVTVTSTNGTVVLNMNNQKIPAVSFGSNKYGASLALTSGNYLYNWSAYGSGTHNNINYSANRIYTVLQGECQQSSECTNKCSGAIYNYSGTCNSGKCSYLQKNCSEDNNWYDTGSKQWISIEECREKEQKEQKYRTYSCSLTGCQYTNTSTQWINTGNTRNKADGTSCNDNNLCTENDVCNSGVCGGSQKNCNDNLFCNGVETCNPSLGCQAGVMIDCSGNNKLISTCDNNPDNIHFTFDSYSFTSSCNEEVDSCNPYPVNWQDLIVHTCSKSNCNAECDDLHLCSATECDNLDGCQGRDYYDYSDVNNICNSTCGCTKNACSNPVITQNDERCGECLVDGDCNALDRNYCLGANRTRDEGKCINYECKAETTFLENCNDNLFCNGVESCQESAGNSLCQPGIATDCSILNLPAVNSCNNNPDNNPFTRDLADSVPAVCDENIDDCSQGTYSFTHSCDKTCGGCTQNSDLSCPIDECLGNYFADYPDNGVCNLTSCIGDNSSSVCSPQLIDDLRCISEINETINISSGNNFISVPLLLENYSIENIFSGNLNKIERIYSYNNGWKVYYAGNPELSSLKELETGKGYVIIASQDFNVDLTGYNKLNNGTISRPKLTLVQGWNLFSPILSTRLSSLNLDYLAAFKFDRNSRAYILIDSDYVLSNKESYWIYMNSAQEI